MIEKQEEKARCDKGSERKEEEAAPKEDDRARRKKCDKGRYDRISAVEGMNAS